MADSYMKKVKLGIIGTGIAARELHWPPLQKLADRFEITAVCNRSEEKAATFAEMVGLSRYYLDYHKMLHEADVSAVLLALPIELNYPVSLECAKAGKHILCEKPVAVNLDQGRKMADLSGRYGVKVQIAEQFYYRDDLRKVCEIVQGGEIGNVFQIRMDVSAWFEPREGYGGTAWRQKPAHRGGIVTDAGVHHMAELRLLGGEVTEVHAYALNQNRAYGDIDNICMNLRFHSGAIGHYTASYTAIRPGRWWVDCIVCGSKGTLEVGHGELRLYHTLEGEQEPERITFEDFDGGFRNQLIAFHEAIICEKPIVATPEETFKDLQILWCALDSADSKSSVRIEETT